MNIKRLGQDDVNVMIPFLERHINTNMFMLNNFQKGGFNPSDEKCAGDYLGLFDEADNLQGVIAHYNLNALMLQVPTKMDLIPTLTKTILTLTKRPIQAILGDAQQVDKVLQTLNIPAENFDMQETEDLMALNFDEATLIQENPAFNFVHNKDIDNEIITNFMVDYDIEALGTTPSEKHTAETKAEVETEEHTKNRWGLELNGEIVSYGGFNAMYKETVQVGPMWTPAHLRGKGYARTLLSHMLNWAKQQGCTKAILFTNTEPAIRTYQSLGFKKQGKFKLCLLNKLYQVEG